MDKLLLEKGFKKVKPSPIMSENIEICFQKRYDDEKGIKYFITINKWKPLTHPYTKEIIGPNYEYTVQLYKKDTHDALDLNFHHEWELQDVENYLDILFDSNLFDYYELFREDLCKIKNNF